jgi:site-specific recombinase XerD
MSVERVFEEARTLRELSSEPLGMMLNGFCDWLLERGFASGTVRKHLGCLLHLNRWLAEQRWCWAGVLSYKEVEGFLKAYPRQCHNRGTLKTHMKPVRYALSRFVEYLSSEGLFESQSVSLIYQPLLDGYLEWMRDHQHSSEGTLKNRLHSIKRFLESQGKEATCEGLMQLSAERVESFFIAYADTMGHSARRSMQAALRTFLRFCFYKGYTTYRLDYAVPTLRTYKLAQVPRCISEEQADTVLKSVDRHTNVGRRDYAILMLLHTYGVRGGQVRALQLNDIQWSQDQILFRALKGGKDSLLPLTVDVGESLLDYLQNARPCNGFPEVFLTSRGPYHPIDKSNTISAIVSTHVRATGINLPCKGSHIFRHAFATRMVAEGHSFKAVADVLGHRYLSTTFIYTKVDFNALSHVALEWPEEVVI